MTGNLGTSLVSSQSVGAALSARLPVPLSLVIGATVLSAMLGIGLGAVSSLRGGVIGQAIDALAMLSFAVPSFWLGLILVDLLAVKAHLLPVTGYVDPSQSVTSWLRSLVLPVVTLVVAGVTGIAKQTRDSFREVMGRDFITALRADGLPEPWIAVRHGLPNAAIPIATLVGVFFISMLGSSVVVEAVFALPGLESLAVSSAQSGDMTMLQGVVVVFCIIVVVVNLLVDVCYGLLNP